MCLFQPATDYTAAVSELVCPVLPRNEAAARVWNNGGRDYDRISRQVADAIEHCVDRLAPQPGERILDMATGTGWTARRLSDRGADVVGIDISDTAIATARRMDRHDFIDFRVADAEALPFADGEFDAVISTFGVMFCGDPEEAASEMTRVCKPGGRIAMAHWDSYGGFYEMSRLLNAYKSHAEGPSPSPFDWSRDDQLEEWFGPSYTIQCERAISLYRESCAEEAWKVFSTCYGPVKSLVESLAPRSVDALRRDFISFHELQSTPVGVLVYRPYVVALLNSIG